MFMKKHYLYFDMEMIPAPEEKRERLYQWFHEKGKKDEELENAFELTSVDGAWGRILCIAYAFDDEEVRVLYREDLDERKLLEEFWGKIGESEIIVGHKILDADIPFLWKRSIVHGVKPSRYFDLRDGRDEHIFDTAFYWSLGKGYSSLEKLCLALELPNPKRNMHGSQVPKYFREGRIQEILDYCKEDTEAVRRIHRKIQAVQ